MRHDQKITVYLTGQELLDLEQARLRLRAEFTSAPPLPASEPRSALVPPPTAEERTGLLATSADLLALPESAMRRVRGDMGLKNVKLMVPFCRTVEEAAKVEEEMARNGLRRGEDGLELYVMVEIPSNVLLIDGFARHFDGFSIGGDELAGIDEDNVSSS